MEPPSVGKLTLCAEVMKQVDLSWIDISEVTKFGHCIVSYDSRLICPIIDEDQVIEELDPVVEEGGKIVEFHSCNVFPECWFDGMFVLRTNNTTLYDRLKERGYNHLKIWKNIECEIFQVSLEEAMDLYDEKIVTELHSNCIKDIENNTEIVVKWVTEWIKDAEKNKNGIFGTEVIKE